MGAWAGAVTAAFTLLAACTGGDGTGPTRPPSSALAPMASTTAPTSSPTTMAAASTADPPGSITFRARRLTLPPGGGLRVLVRAATSRLTVRRTGSGGALAVCPVADATGRAGTDGCGDLGSERVVELGAGTGVEIRATGSGATVDEVSITYLPVDRSMTLVTPARPAGSCSATVCEAAFSLGPAQAGSFTLDGRSTGSRPRLVVQAVAAPAGSSRVLATVEGGGALSIRATLEPSAQAVVLYQEQVDGPVGALVMEILWP